MNAVTPVGATPELRAADVKVPLDNERKERRKQPNKVQLFSLIVPLDVCIHEESLLMVIQ